MNYTGSFRDLVLENEEWRKQPVDLTQSFPTPRDAVSWIMDNFPIVKRKNEAKFSGDFHHAY